MSRKTVRQRAVRACHVEAVNAEPLGSVAVGATHELFAVRNAFIRVRCPETAEPGESSHAATRYTLRGAPRVPALQRALRRAEFVQRAPAGYGSEVGKTAVGTTW